MEDLLFGLTPSEFWVLNYLQYLAHKQGGCPIILPRPGEDARAEKVYSRKQLKRILKSLKSKYRLTRIIIPRSKSKQIEIYLSIRETRNFIGDTHVPNLRKDPMGVPNNGGLRTSRSAITPLGTPTSPINQGVSGGLAQITPSPSLSSSSFKELVELKQGDLKGEISSMEEGTARKMRFFAEGICKAHPKGKKLSDKAKLYAMIRLIQAAETVEKPQAYVDTVARVAEKEFYPDSRRSCRGGRREEPARETGTW